MHAARRQRRRRRRRLGALMRCPAAMAADAEKATLPDGSGDRFAGYGVMALPFASGHVLALRRFPASSIGPAYTSVWHRDPTGTWVFWQDRPAHQGCARYFSAALSDTRRVAIDLDWPADHTLRVAIAEVGLLWTATLAPTPATRVLNGLGRIVPDRAWRSRRVLQLMGPVAGRALGAGTVAMAGTAPNGQRFVANPMHLWVIDDSTACLGGDDFGPVGPLETQARLGDFWMPQRGVFAIGRAFFDPAGAADPAGVRGLLTGTAEAAAEFLEGLDRRPVRASATLEELRAALDVELSDEPVAAADVLDHLRRSSDPGVVATPSGRFFGFVVGGTLPAALAADWMTSAWDQNAGLFALAPAAAVVEETAGRWLKDLLRLPPSASFAFVTGCQMAHFTALAAARHHVLQAAGWDVNEGGLSGAPPIRVLVGADRHVTVDRALRYLGIGQRAIVTVTTDDEGRMLPGPLADALRAGSGPTIVCAQAGEVNTGAIDPLGEICDLSHRAGAWVHVDGAFGMWAAASPARAHLVAGIERADSWATDAHKWLNVPYDCGLVFCAHPASHHRAMSVHADYLVHAGDSGPRDQVDWGPEFSRRARGFPVYAALRALGRTGVGALVDAGCAHAGRLAAALADIDGIEIVNQVQLNQVLVRFGDDDQTNAVLARVQGSGECWMSGTIWRGRAAMRISVVNWQTSDDDVERTIAAITSAHHHVRAGG